MGSRFARAQARMHRVCADRLSDGQGDFIPMEGAPVKGIPLGVDRNLQAAGAEEVFMTDMVGITFHCSDLASADRGDVFTFDGERFIVEKELANDGHVITVATMVHS